MKTLQKKQYSYTNNLIIPGISTAIMDHDIPRI